MTHMKFQAPFSLKNIKKKGGGGGGGGRWGLKMLSAAVVINALTADT